MNANAVSVTVVDGKIVSKTVELGSAGRGQTLRVQAVKGGAYLLAEGETRLAPENVTVKRAGKDLHLCLEHGELDEPQLIIEGFYGSDGQLVGVAEDGSFHEYIASDALDSDGMADGSVTALALGVTPLSGFGTGSDSGGFWVPAMLGLGALGVAGAIAAIAGGGGGGSGSSPVLAPEPETPPADEAAEEPAPEEGGDGEERGEEPPVVAQEPEPAEDDPVPILMFSGSEQMFDHSALTHRVTTGDEAWATALSLGDVLSLDSGELFIDDATTAVNQQWIYDAQEEVDLQALISDEEAENWSSQTPMSDVGVVYELVQPSAPIDDALFQGQE